jgi:hypothetical protein
MSKDGGGKPKKLPGKGFRMPEPLIPAFIETFDLYAIILKKKHGFELTYTRLLVAWCEEFVANVKAGTPPIWPPKFNLALKEETFSPKPPKPPPKRFRR